MEASQRGILGERGGSRVAGRFIFGGIVVMLGVLFLLDNFNILDSDDFLRYWPVALIAIGAFKLIGGPSVPERTAGVIWLLIGGLLLGNALDLFNFRVWKLWPLIMVVVGLNILGSAMSRRPNANVQSDERFSAFAMMSGVVRKLDTPNFQRGDATAIMGGCEVDLRQASISQSPAVIDVFACWGGIDIMVPGDWTIRNECFAILGGVDDSRKQTAGDPNKQLVLRGGALMGGIEIKN